MKNKVVLLLSYTPGDYFLYPFFIPISSNSSLVQPQVGQTNEAKK